MFASFGSAAGSLDDLTADQIDDADVTDEVRAARARDEPLHGDARALPLARAPVRGAGLGGRLPLGGHRRREVGVGLQPRHHEPRRRHARQSDPPEEKLVPIYPTDGYYGADNPAVVLTGDWVDETEAAAGQDFLRYAGTKQGQQIVRESGYRDLNGELDPLVAEVGAARRPTRRARCPSRAPGSSARPTRRSPRCASARRCCSSSTSPGRWRSRSRRQDQARRRQGRDHAGARPLHARRQRRPRRLLGRRRRRHHARARQPRRRHRHRARRLPEGARRPASPSSSRRSTRPSTRSRQQRADDWQADRINAIVLLSDGKNETLTPTIAADQMLANLKRATTTTTRCSSSRSRTVPTPTSRRCSRSRARPAPTTTTPPTRPRSATCSATSSRASEPRSLQRRPSWSAEAAQRGLRERRMPRSSRLRGIRHHRRVARDRRAP